MSVWQNEYSLPDWEHSLKLVTAVGKDLNFKAFWGPHLILCNRNKKISIRNYSVILIWPNTRLLYTFYFLFLVPLGTEKGWGRFQWVTVSTSPCGRWVEVLHIKPAQARHILLLCGRCCKFRRECYICLKRMYLVKMRLIFSFILIFALDR